MISLIAFIPGAVLTVIALIRLAREPRRISNGVFILAAGLFMWLGLTVNIGFISPAAAGVFMGLSLLMVVGLIIAIGASLMANGIIGVRKEGLRASTVLAFAAGLAILAGFFGGLLLISGALHPIPSWLFIIGLVIVQCGFVLFLQLIGFYITTKVYRGRRVPQNVDAIVALGCGLRNGEEVTPLLASRLDRAKELYDDARVHGHTPVLVASGGQGRDEKVPEAVAMARYLTAQGVPAHDVVVEDKSTTTMENLKFSTNLLEERFGRKDFNAVIATSDFHAFRAGLLARKNGFPYQATGGRTARYYYPTAFLREFVAVLTYSPVTLVAVYGLVTASAILSQL